MRGTFKGRSGYVAGAVALLVVGFSLISGLARRIGVVEPRIRIERSSDNNPSQAARAARYVTTQGAMVGGTATTVERLREASALAAAGAWLAGTQRTAHAGGVPNGSRLRKGTRMRRGCSGNWKRLGCCRRGL